MAIQKSFISKYGITSSSAYHRIERADCKKEGSTLALVKIYNSSSDKDKIALDSFDFQFTMDITDNGANPIKQAYVYLKSQASFNGIDYTDGSTDV